jgi:acetoacetyl-CoA synthetase
MSVMFWSKFWDYAGVIGEKGAVAAHAHGDKMPGAQFFPEGRINWAENLTETP